MSFNELLPHLLRAIVDTTRLVVSTIQRRRAEPEQIQLKNQHSVAICSGKEAPPPTSENVEIEMKEVLCDIITRRFSTQELKQFVAFEYPELFGTINLQGSQVEVAFELINALSRHGLLGDDLHRKLLDARPHVAQEIDEVFSSLNAG